ncbi:asparagine synthase (glutamine-hydrolyzing) [bacterium]|nr:asparagine synthase (glutamine-hydrolyzing) [bacterium]
MCGIYGFTQNGLKQPEAETLLQRMGQMLRHRGPDGEGAHLDDDIALGHRRLKIIDLESGDQPMHDWLGRYVISFNGEIYNFKELRQQFEQRGFRFRTRSDTEAILAAYHFMGKRCVESLQGMFAFALWDKAEKKLLLARDRLGKKPLYYFHQGERLVFASEMKAILSAPNVPREIDFEALNHYLTFGYIPAPLTIFKHIRKLQAAQSLTFFDGTVSFEDYWALPEPENGVLKSEEELVEELEALLASAVDLRLISEVPLGAFLSGGTDSSAIVAMMAKLNQQPVRTFTIDFSEEGFSEVDDARRVASHCGVEYNVLKVSTDAINTLPKLVWHFDEPFGDASAIPTYYVSQLAREHVTVILSGDGGDELFAGYRSYMQKDQYSTIKRLPRSLRRRLLAPIAHALPIQARARNFLKYAAYATSDDGPQALGIYPYIKEDIVTRSIRRELSAFDATSLRRTILAALKSTDKLTRLQYVDAKLYLPEDILMKVDRMSMAHSLETRAPLLDYRLVEFATRLPVHFKMRDSMTKYLLKKLLLKYLPPETLVKKKQGFAVPINRWFQQQLNGYTAEVLLDQRCRQRGYFNLAVVQKVLQHHATGRRDYSEWIWLLLNLELWFQTFVDPATRKI